VVARNRSAPAELTISLPAQTHAYLVKLASVGALGQTEALIAARIVVNKVERLMKKRRAETILAGQALPPSDGNQETA
jgi:hypothetical protein